MHITQQFLTALFGPEVDALSRILIWSAPGKHSFFTRSAEEAAAQARKLAPRQNVYFGCGLAPKGLAHYERAGSASVRGIPGIWADIDIADPKAHAKTALAPDLDAAIALAVALPLPPTLIVRSGHGIQPWWLFKEPWLFTDEQATQNRAAAQDAVRGWQNLLKAEAAARGWEHDATHDLARVLRLPGTFNHKDPDNLKAVTVSDWHDAQRYNPEDFSGYLLDDGGPYNSPADGLGGSPYSSLAQFEAAAAVPPPLFSAPLPGAALSQAFVTLLDDDPKLKNTWLRKRRNLKDSSLSGYDMALAGILAAYPDIFSDQQIADVLCAFRHKHAEPGSKDWKKGTDHAYLFRTIRRARMQRFADTRLSRLIQSLAAPTYETGPACGPAFESDPACGPAHEINPAFGSDPACAPVSETVPAPGPDFPPAPGPACAPLSDPDSETGPAPEFPPVPETAPAPAPELSPVLETAPTPGPDFPPAPAPASDSAPDPAPGPRRLSAAERAHKLSALSALLRIKLLGLRCYKSDPAHYELVLPHGPARLGDIGKIIGQTDFRKAFAEATRVVLPTFKGPQWLSICQALLDICEDVDVGEEGTQTGLCRAWLAAYLEEYRPLADLTAACRSRYPFRTPDGRTGIFLTSLREWLAAQREYVKTNELSVALRACGCTPERLKVTLKDASGTEKETTRSVFILPGRG